MPIILTERFARAYAKLPGDVQKKVDKALRLLDEARVDRRHRMTYHREGDRLVMSNVGEHDTTLEHP